MSRLLLVDDDVELAEMLVEYLASEGFATDVAALGEDGAQKAADGAYAAVILDVMLPDINGFEVLRRLRTQSLVPVVMLTARAEEVDRIVGLEIGADDYVRKPFSPRELVARVQAILRRTASTRGVRGDAVDPDVLRVGDLHLDLLARVVRQGHAIIELTATEFELLRMLLTTPGRVVTRDELSRQVLGREHSVFDRSIDNHISALRRKLGAGARGIDRIKSVRHVGYVYAYLHA